MSTVKSIAHKIVTIGVAVATVFVSFAGVMAAQAVDASCPATVVPGAMIQVTTPVKKAAVYAVDNSGSYRYFDSGDTFKTLNADNSYAGIVGISQACFNSLTQPAQGPFHVFPRYGSGVYKYLSGDQLYSMGMNGTLYPITAAAATALYGANYKVMTVGLSEWPYYTKSNMSFDGTKVIPGMLVSNGGKTWLVSDATTVREVTAAGMTGNRFKAAYVRPVSDAMVAGFTTGAPVTGMEAALSDRLQSGGVANQPQQVSVGSLNVALGANTPAGGNVPVNTNDTTGPFPLSKVLNLNFSAGTNAVTVTGVNLTRAGLSTDSDLTNVVLMDGSTVIASNLGISNGKINFSNPNGLFVVGANSTKTITVAVQVSTAGAGHTFTFSVASAGDVTSNGTTGGAFPISSNTFTGTSVANLGGLQITNSSVGTTSATALSVNAGQKQFVAGQFTLLAQNQLMQVRSIKFTETGSLNPANDLANVTLYNGGQSLGTGTWNGNTVVFDLSANPLQLNSGQSAVLYLYTDVPGGVNRYFQFSIQQRYDVVAHDMMYNNDVLPTLNTGNFAVNMSYVNVNAGTLVVTKNATSPTTNYVPGGTNQVLAKIDMTANGEAVRVTGYSLNFQQIGNILSASNLTNVRVVDDQGQQIGTTQSTISTTTNPYAPSSLNYIVPANTTRVISIIADVASSATGAVQAGFSSITAQGFTSLNAISLSGQYGNVMTNSGALLTANLNSGLNSVSVVAGQPAAKVASFALVAGAASAVSVSNVSLSVPSAALNATTSAAFQNLKVMVGQTQLGQTQGTLSDGGSMTFTASNPIVIPAGGQVVLDVFADVKNASATFSASPVVKLAASGVSAIAAATNQAVTNVPSSVISGQNVTLQSAGTVTVSIFNTPAAAQVGMGVNNVKLATYKFTGSANEAMQVNNVTLSVTSSIPAAFTNFRLMSGSKVYGNGLNLTSVLGGTTSTLSWVGVNIPVAQNGNIVLDVVADANTWAAIQPSGAETTSLNITTTARVSSVDYQGASSGSTGTATTADAASNAGNTFNLLRTTLAASTASGVTYATGVTDSAVVGAFTFVAGPNDDAVLNQVVLQHVYSGATTTAGTPTGTVYHLYDATNNQDVATNTIAQASGSSKALTLNLNNAATGGVSGAAGYTIPKGTSKTFLVRADLNSGTFARSTGGSPITFQVQLTGWTWSDGTRTGLSADTAFLLPVAGSLAAVNL